MPRAGKVTAQLLAAASTTDAGWEDTYVMLLAAGDKPGGAATLLALAKQAGMTDLPNKTARLESAAVIAAIKRAAERRADAAKVPKRAGSRKARTPLAKRAKVATPVTKAKGAKGKVATPVTKAKGAPRATPSASASDAGTDEDEEDEASSPLRPAPARIGKTGWLTVQSLEEQGVIGSALLDLVRASTSLGMVSPNVLSAVLEGLYDVIAPGAKGAAARALGEGKAGVYLSAVDIARLRIAGPPVTAIAETVPGGDVRQALYAGMYASLLGRAASDAVMPSAVQFEGAADTLVQECIAQVYPKWELDLLAAKCGAVGQVQAVTAAAAIAAAGKAAVGESGGAAASKSGFPLLYIDLKAKSSAATGVAVPFGRVAAAHLAQKMAPFLRDQERYLLPQLPFTSMEAYASADGRCATERATGGFRITATGVCDLDREFEEEQLRAAAALDLNQLIVCAEIHAQTVYILCHGMMAASGQEPRFSFRVLMQMLDAVRVFGAVPGLTAAGFRQTLLRAYDKGAMLLAAAGSVEVRPSVSAAYLAMIQEIEGSATHMTRAAAVGTQQAEQLASVVAELARVRALKSPATPKAPAAPKAQAEKKAGNPRGNLEPRLPGGIGKAGVKCTNAAHDPAQAGDPKKWCGGDHSHWGQAEPSQAAMDKARAEVKANLGAVRAGRRARGRGRGK